MFVKLEWVLFLLWKLTSFKSEHKQFEQKLMRANDVIQSSGNKTHNHNIQLTTFQS